MEIVIRSKKNKRNYRIYQLSEYEIETSLDIPADHFNMIIENPIGGNGHGVNSEILNPNDSFFIYENGKVILDGISDDVDETWDESNCRVEIDGRDRSMLLLENDAEPRTYNKLKFSDFLKMIASPYGFTKFKVNPKCDKVINKIVVEIGESEWDILFKQAKKLGLWLWCTPDSTIVADTLNYNGSPSYKFSNDSNQKDAIFIKKLCKRKRGADIKSEIWVRGHGKRTFTVKKSDSNLVSIGYKRRVIMEDGQVKNISEAEKAALAMMKEKKRGSFEIEITINGKYDIETNRTAQIVDKITKIDGVFFIIAIKTRKNDSNGIEKVIRLRPLGEEL